MMCSSVVLIGCDVSAAEYETVIYSTTLDLIKIQKIIKCETTTKGA